MRISSWSAALAAALSATGMGAANAVTPVGNAVRVNNFTSGHQASPSVARDATGDFVVTWTSLRTYDDATHTFIEQDGSRNGVYARRFHADATPKGKEFRVNDITLSDQSAMDLAMNADGSFVVIWTSDAALHATRYGADGHVLGPSTRLDENAAIGHPVPILQAQVALDADGDFAVAWSEYDRESKKKAIVARRFHADGSSVTGAIKVAVAPASLVLDSTGLVELEYVPNLSDPHVVSEPDGDFVVSWQSQTDLEGSVYLGCRYCATGTYGQFGPSRIRARRYGASGLPAGLPNTVARGAEYELFVLRGAIDTGLALGNDPSTSAMMRLADGTLRFAWQVNHVLAEPIIRMRAATANIVPQLLSSRIANGYTHSVALGTSANGGFVVAADHPDTTIGGNETRRVILHAFDGKGVELPSPAEFVRRNRAYYYEIPIDLAGGDDGRQVLSYSGSSKGDRAHLDVFVRRFDAE
jgi:hypothetical protein